MKKSEIFLKKSESGVTDLGISGVMDLWSKTKGLTQTGPNLNQDRSGPFSRTDGLGSVRSTDLRSGFELPWIIQCLSRISHKYEYLDYMFKD